MRVRLQLLLLELVVAIGSSVRTIKLGQVTPIGGCFPHKYGARYAVDLINSLNGGRGFSVGTGNDTFRFELLTVEVGNITAGGTAPDQNDLHHAAILRLIDDDRVDLLIGSCSSHSFNESRTADGAGRIIMAQVCRLPSPRTAQTTSRHLLR